MKREQLPQRAQDELVTLEKAILQALDTSKTQHSSAVSQSSLLPNTTIDEAMSGGSLTAPEKPPIDYDERAISEMHRRVHESSEGCLHAVVVHAERSPEGSWTLHTKLVSFLEHEALTRLRQPTDAIVEAELRRWTNIPNWERVSFGRSSARLPVKLFRSSASGRETLETPANLMAQLAAAEKLYADAGLKLLVAHWTLRVNGLEFREYFE